MLRVVVVTVALALCRVPASAAGPNSTLLVSRPSGLGTLPVPGDGDSGVGRNAISGDGRKIVFISVADDLGVHDNAGHVWVRDTVADTTTLVDRVPGGGAPGDGVVTAAAISRDGSAVCFVGSSTNLVAGVTGSHVFVVTLSSGAIAVADRAATGALGNGDPVDCALDASGARVAFESFAGNLVSDDTNAASDVFVRDLVAGSTIRVSEDSADGQAPSGGRRGAINADGTRIAFVSGDPLVAGDTNGADDVYVRDLQAGTLVRASVATGGVQANGSSGEPAIDDGGAHVAFSSRASNLEPGGDTNGKIDIYWRDLGSDTTVAVSRATGAAGPLADGDCSSPAISGDGLGVAFQSRAANLGGGAPQSQLAYLRRLNTNETLVLSRADGAAGDVANRFSGIVSLGTAPTASAWVSLASNLDPDASGEFAEVFKRDLSGEPATVLVSRPSGTGPRNATVNLSFIGPRSISADGRLVTFVSRADGIEPAAAGPLGHVFVRDTVTDLTALVSRGPGPVGVVANGDSFHGAISASGTHVAFLSAATNLLPGVSGSQVYVRDLATGDLQVASRADGVTGALATAIVGDRPDISADGTRVVFATRDALVPADGNGVGDVYLRDLEAGTTTLVSAATGGGAGNGASSSPTLSDDGRLVAFVSGASDLLGGAPVSGTHLYVRDLETGETVLADRRSADGAPGSGRALAPEISGSGNRIAFLALEALTPEAISPSGGLYVRDLASGTTILAGRGDGPGGAAAASPVGYAISEDGARVSFGDEGPGLPGPANTFQIFVRDLGAGTTTLASAADGTAATPANADAGGSALNAGGGCVAFDSQADNLSTPAYATRDFRQVYLRTVTGECPVLPVTPLPSGTPIAAKSLVLRPGKLLKFVVIPPVGLSTLAGDPTAGGGRLAVTGTTGATSYDLPGAGWKAVGRRKPKGFEFTGDQCRVSLLRKRIKGTCRGDTGSLRLPEPGPLAVVLTVGVENAALCAECGGKAAGKPERVFKRKRCGAPASCAP